MKKEFTVYDETKFTFTQDAVNATKKIDSAIKPVINQLLSSGWSIDQIHILFSTRVEHIIYNKRVSIGIEDIEKKFFPSKKTKKQ